MSGPVSTPSGPDDLRSLGHILGNVRRRVQWLDNTGQTRSYRVRRCALQRWLPSASTELLIRDEMCGFDEGQCGKRIDQRGADERLIIVHVGSFHLGCTWQSSDRAERR